VDSALVSVDSTTARAHHQAAGMVVDPELLEEPAKAVGEEKGLHAAGTQVAPTDPAYSSRANRANLRRRRIRAVIPEQADQAAHRKKRGSRGGRPVSHDPELDQERNTAERCINRIEEWRGLAFRFDKTPESYLAGLHLRGAIVWIRSLRAA
jgi:Transposase DDE domain